MTTTTRTPIRSTITARMLDYDFMRTAFIASGLAAALAGTVGFFLVLRGQTFAGHALSHVGFTGATGAILFGLPPLAGLIGFTFISGIGMGLFGEKLAERDVAIGMVLSIALGLGLLFLHFYTSAATQAAALLFGNVLGVDPGALVTLAILTAASLAALAVDRPAAGLRLAPVRACGGARRAGAPRLDRFPGDRGGRDCGMRPDRRRAPRLHAHGRTGRRRVEPHRAASRRPSPFRRRSRSQKPGED